MGEVNDMKKVISVVMCVVMLLCCGCFAGCSSQSEKSSKTYSQSPEYLAHYDSLVQALREGGFKEAHYISDDRSNVYLREDDDKNAVFVPKKKDSIYISNLDNDIDLVKLIDILLKFCFNEENRSQKIVDDMYNTLRASSTPRVVFYDDYDVLFHPDTEETYIDSVTIIPHDSIPNLSTITQ